MGLHPRAKGPFALAALKFDMHLVRHACKVLQQKSFEFVSAFSVLHRFPEALNLTLLRAGPAGGSMCANSRALMAPAISKRAGAKSPRGLAGRCAA